MTRHRLLVFGLLAGLLVLGIGGWLLWSCTAPGVTSESFGRLRTGFMVHEVEGILGGPSHDKETFFRKRRLGGPEEQISRQTWHGVDFRITVLFLEDGSAEVGELRVNGGIPVATFNHRPEVFLDKVRRRLGL